MTVWGVIIPVAGLSVPDRLHIPILHIRHAKLPASLFDLVVEFVNYILERSEVSRPYGVPRFTLCRVNK